ncbi:MAG: fatty acid desaturase [Algicola sp.]|nr:fatty acid desaturase [Algicola sp.]
MRVFLSRAAVLGQAPYHYAKGWRRYIDWFDWIRSDAWNYEHNYLHHSFTGEDKDPDLVEDNLKWLADMNVPSPVKALILFFFASTWKFTYYSGRTLSYLRGYNAVNFKNFLDVRQKAQRHMWFELFLPYITFNFVLLPLACEFIAPGFGVNFLIMRLIAEYIHNIHMFAVIIPNHAGADLCRFDNVEKMKRRGPEYYVRQILGSANFSNGSEWLDLGHMYLNYQIEHHLFPALPMRQYRIIQPQVRAVCEKYGVNYIQESVFMRGFKMVKIALGNQKMRRVSGELPS